MENILVYDELDAIREAGKVAAEVLRELKRIIKPGISTKDVEIFFEDTLKRYPDMEAAFKGYQDYPASLCVSVNEEIIHGIPSERKLITGGDLVSVDLGIKYKGLFVDTAFTYMVGEVSSIAERLVETCRIALSEAIKKVQVGGKIGDLSAAVQNSVETKGFSVIRNFVGHGIGRVLHTFPEIPNFGKENTGPELVEGMVLAIEPMIAIGNYEIDILDDGWTAKTKDNSLSAHFEHTVAVTKKGPWILS